MTKPRTYKVVTFFCGSGAKTLGLLRARGKAGSRFESVGAFDIDPLAVADFELLTGACGQVLDLAEVSTEQLAERCVGRPDMVVMSPPCKGFSGCLPEGVSKAEKYQLLNKLALRAVNLAVETWSPPPALIMLENVPRMRTRGAELLEQMKAVLRGAGYEVDLRPHDCGEWGGLAQKRERLLLIARHREQAPSHLMQPPNLGLRPMSSVLWQLPPPLPPEMMGDLTGGPHHKLPKLSELNWLRLAAIPAGQDWRAIPERVRIVGDVDPRCSDRRRGSYGVEDPKAHAHVVRGRHDVWAAPGSVSDPRCGGDPSGRQNGLYGVCSDGDPSHVVVGAARAGSHSWASVSDPRLDDRGTRQNGGRGVNDASVPSHSVMAEGSVSNTWSSVNDPRLGCSPRAGTMGVGRPGDPSSPVIGTADIHNSGAAIADPRSSCHRREDSIGVSDPGRPYKTSVIGHQKIENSPTSVADPRVVDGRVPPQNRGNFGVQDPARPSATIRAQHPARTAPSLIADGRLFEPTHELVAGQPWTGKREEWVRGEFALVGSPLELRKGGRPKYVIIRAPDNTVHRPLTTAELMLLQGFPVWHRPGDPAEIGIGEGGGCWVQMAGNNALVREHVGNAVPVPTAQAIGEVSLGLLDAAGEQVFSLSSGGVWVLPAAGGEQTA